MSSARQRTRRLEKNNIYLMAWMAWSIFILKVRFLGFGALAFACWQHLSPANYSDSEYTPRYAVETMDPALLRAHSFVWGIAAVGYFLERGGGILERTRRRSWCSTAKFVLALTGLAAPECRQLPRTLRASVCAGRAAPRESLPFA